MLIPSGKPTLDMAKKLIDYLEPNDILIDGGNAYYLDSNKLGEMCAKKEENNWIKTTLDDQKCHETYQKEEKGLEMVL